MTWIQTDETGRVTATTDQEQFATGMSEFDFPDGFDFAVQSEYRIVDGELVHDPLPMTEEELAYQEERERRRQLEAAIPMMVRASAASMTDAQLLEVPLLFEEYEVGRDYAAGDVFRHDGELYRVAQSHTSQAQWVPGEAGTESLYTHITVDPETGYDVWQQPTGAHDAYDTGDRVLYPDADGKVYESTIDGNVWSPEAYPQGWREVSE